MLQGCRKQPPNVTRSSTTMNQEAFIGKNVMKRDGSVVAFDPHKIHNALLLNALDARGHRGGSISQLSQRDRDLLAKMTDSVVERLAKMEAVSIPIEDIQDQVELALMRAGDLELARSYMLYRAAHAEDRKQTIAEPSAKPVIRVLMADGQLTALDTRGMAEELLEYSVGLDLPDVQLIVDRTEQQCYDEVPVKRVRDALLLSVRERMEMFPDATFLAARVKIADVIAEVHGEYVKPADFQDVYESEFASFIKRGVQAELLDPKLAEFDLVKIATALNADRDRNFDYLGIDTICDRYLLHVEGTRIELPQWLYMRVAMGLSLNEINREDWAIAFYEVLSTGDFMSSTPTLFNSGTRRPQLSSCYLTTVEDDLDGIYEALKENALLSKFAGGLGNDWTNVRALGAHIKGTNGKSQGIVPFLKVVNDTAVAVNQGGKRKGAVCAYLETWHLDIEEFLELRKNTGDDRRRTHDMNTANWIPDLFMKRVMAEAEWTLFSPSDAKGLHDLFGKAFEERYLAYEAAAARGEIKLHKKIPAVQLWRKMLGMLFETSHPWITFKDPSNIRSPQQHVGVVHSSNLCTEITLNTNEEEIAVCNLGSVNLVNHLRKREDGKVEIDGEKLGKTVKIAMRMLDNVIDINHYPVKKARNSNLKHRPVGLGIMGFHDMLQEARVPYGSEEAVRTAGVVQEVVCFHAYKASNELAIERGAYSTFKGSLWSRGILPHKSVALLEEQRGESVGFVVEPTLDWSELEESIRTHGMRNSNCCAIAPTATISNIVGVSQAIDPIYQNLFAKSNLGGEYTIVNRRLVKDLKKLGLWDESMVDDLKHYDGSVGAIERVPAELRELYATSFEIDPKWIIESGARRQVWIDQAQSLNIYMAGASGKKLDEIYKLAWKRGLKSTYYLRTIAATHVEKSTGRIGQLNAVSSNVPDAPATPVEADGPVCTMRPGDPGFESCEACQ
ncbi:ribonucleoside-diphosphate reductase subunit alpha [Burkholderia gladioli]|uniref:ribonucleoside-diphosphate reductase subunit alpha n=1 Tax=Burkholderia gladioli TaxID=28095 RepID=UPI0024460DCD|nr:ribonucleoside-diphosphate reductase subunit alpha [Burkholderia gladioli]